MEIRRTANAGVLLKLDDFTILLDGVCREVSPYLATPPQQRRNLTENWPDLVAFTHIHDDHFDGDYARQYCRATGNFPCSTDQAAKLFPDCIRAEKFVTLGSVRITAVPTRHMGRAFADTEHCSFVIEGSRCVWFLGDATPTQLREFTQFPKPDVLIVPFPYLVTPAARRLLEPLMPCEIVLVHMPLRENDPDGIWQMAQEGIEELGNSLHCPQMGENLAL